MFYSLRVGFQNYLVSRKPFILHKGSLLCLLVPLYQTWGEELVATAQNVLVLSIIGKVDVDRLGAKCKFSTMVPISLMFASLDNTL